MEPMQRWGEEKKLYKKLNKYIAKKIKNELKKEKLRRESKALMFSLLRIARVEEISNAFQIEVLRSEFAFG